MSFNFSLRLPNLDVYCSPTKYSPLPYFSTTLSPFLYIRFVLFFRHCQLRLSQVVANGLVTHRFPPSSFKFSHMAAHSSEAEKELQQRESLDDSLDDSQPSESLLKQPDDVEAQKPVQQLQPQQIATEHTVSLKRKLFFLGVYFILNLVLTLSNKAVLSRVSEVLNGTSCL